MIQKERKKHEFIEKCDSYCRVYSYLIPSAIFLTQASKREDSEKCQVNDRQRTKKKRNVEIKRISNSHHTQKCSFLQMSSKNSQMNLDFTVFDLTRK